MNERQRFAYKFPINYGEPTDLYAREESAEVAGMPATITTVLFCSREREAFDGRPYWAVVCSIRNFLGQALIRSFEQRDLLKIYDFCQRELEGVGIKSVDTQILALGRFSVTLARAMTDEEIARLPDEWNRIEVAEHAWVLA